MREPVKSLLNMAKVNSLQYKRKSERDHNESSHNHTDPNNDAQDRKNTANFDANYNFNDDISPKWLITKIA